MQESARDQSSQSVVSKVLEDQAFVSSILASVCVHELMSFKNCQFCLYCHCPDMLFLSQLPGVDPNDPSVRDLIASMQSQSEVSL